MTHDAGVNLPRRSLLAAGASLPVLVGPGRALAAPAALPDNARVPLGRVDATMSSARMRLRDPLTRPTRTAPFRMLAVTWRGDVTPEVEVRTRHTGGWSDWRVLRPLGDGPDLGSEEDNPVNGTELVWVGLADGVQVRTSKRSDDLALVLVDPALLPDGQTVQNGRRAPVARPIVAAGMRPKLFTRGGWGANPDWRSGSARYGSTIKVGHVHHTVSSNSYSRSDVRGMIRGMYYYHTQHLGWSDIGYNFLIDKFGRIWIGRGGGGRRPVRGAHTLGFNQASFGVALIGTFTNTTPTAKAQHALVRLMAWKLNKYGRNPTGWTTLTSEGSDRYRRGVRARLRVIDGHRDTNQTACPGDRLYALLPSIRTRTKRRINRLS